MFSTVGNHTLTATITDGEGKSKAVNLTTSAQAPTLKISGQYRSDGSAGVNFTFPLVTFTIDKQNYPSGAVFQTTITTKDPSYENGWTKVYTKNPNGGNGLGSGYYKYEAVVTDMWGQTDSFSYTTGNW